MVSLTKMTGLGAMLTRGCCSLKEKKYFGEPRCKGGEMMENEHGSVRETNCLHENCNDGNVEEQAIIEQSTSTSRAPAERQQQPQVIRFPIVKIVCLFKFTGKGHYKATSTTPATTGEKTVKSFIDYSFQATMKSGSSSRFMSTFAIFSYLWMLFLSTLIL